MARYSINEGLDSFSASDEPSIPSYLVAADTHNLANGNDSFFDSVENAVTGAGKFVIASLASGANQLYNIAPSLGNLFGGDFELSKTEDVMEMLDSDLAQYYKQNSQVVDVAGFIASSLIPGMAGVKFLNAGQTALRGAAETGKLGTNLAAATNLLAPSQPKLLAEAVKAAVSPNAAQAVWNPNTLRAVAANLTQNTLEGIAFTTAVEATMFNSPVLESHDVGDIASNIMYGGLLQGAIGGALGTAGIAHKIYKKLREVGREVAPVTTRHLLTESAPASSKILTYLDDANTTPFPDDASEFAQKFLSLRETKLRNIEVDVRNEFGTLAGGDQPLAQLWYDWHKIVGTEQTEKTLFGMLGVSRVNHTLKEESKINAIIAKGLEATPEETAFVNNHKITYYKNWGEAAGNHVDEAPRVVGIADTIKPSQKFKDVINGYGQTLKKVWNPLTSSHLEAEARYITAMKTTLQDGVEISYTDLPYLQAAREQAVLPAIKLADSSVWTPSTMKELTEHILQAKESIALKLAKDGVDSAKIAKIVDAQEDWLHGVKLPEDKNAFAMRHAQDTYTQNMKSAKLLGEDAAQIPVWEIPQYTKVLRDVSPITDIDGVVVEGMAAIKASQKIYATQAGVIADNIIGQEIKFSPISDKAMLTANPRGPGGSLISSMNENFGQLGMVVQYNGQQVLKAIKTATDSFDNVSTPILYKLASNEAAAIEWSVLNARLRSIPEQYILDPSGASNLVLARWRRYQEAVSQGAKVAVPEIADDIPKTIPIRNADTYEVTKLHIESNSKRVEAYSKIRTQQGVKFERDPQAFYPIPADPRNFKFYAFVVDDSITNTFGKSKMVHATDAANLEAQITELKKLNPSLKIFTGKDAEAYYKSIGQFEYERTLTDVTFDASFKRTGTSATMTPMTDPARIVEDFKNWHHAREANLIREATLLKFEPQVKTLMKLGDDFSSVQRSHYTAMDALSYVQNTEKNPYHDYVKTLIGVSTAKDYPIYTAVNELLDRKVSSLFNSIYETFYTSKSVAELDKINSLMHEYGYTGPAYSAMMNTLANHSAPVGVLTDYVRKANAVLGTVMLRLDPINALNNIIGANVLLGAEVKAVTRAIMKGDQDAVGELSQLLHIQTPGTGDLIRSPSKLIANSMKRFHSQEGKELRELYKQRGYITSISDTYMETISGLALSGSENAATLTSKLDKVVSNLKSKAQLGEKLTGNTFAEEFNRFVAADVMKQLTDIAVKSGKLSSEEAWAYINTFVNRTQGNFIAAQRPGMFSGPVGQAIGLFQTYQFNFLQQLLRHVGEGSAKDTATLLGLQSSIYGLNGLPAFNAINTHIIGTASGNKDHRDTYDFMYGAAGKVGGDWLMYGIGSNVWGLIHPDLRMNLYTRGDINPRQLTVVPVNPADVPIVNAAAKFFSSMKQTTSNIADGGNVWTSILQGIEHSGINRPLAGLAQTFEAFTNPQLKSYSTSSKGNVIAANDLWSIANLTRVAGAKPLDEALAIDRSFSLDVYATKDAEDRKDLGRAIKTAVIGGNQVTREQIVDFAKEYAARGGKQEKFNQFFMQQFRAANTSQANEMMKHLADPSAQSMQRLLGGYNLSDFSN